MPVNALKAIKAVIRVQAAELEQWYLALAAYNLFV
jgi:hypothetical protein